MNSILIQDKASTSKYTALKKSGSKGESTEMSSPAKTDKGSSSGGGDGEATLMWVDKHKPASLKQIIGQCTLLSSLVEVGFLRWRL